MAEGMAVDVDADVEVDAVDACEADRKDADVATDNCEGGGPVVESTGDARVAPSVALTHSISLSLPSL